MSNLLAPAIVQLSVPEDVTLEEPITIEDFKCISSYTWMSDKSPAIVVPGECLELLSVSEFAEGDRSVDLQAHLANGSIDRFPSRYPSTEGSGSSTRMLSIWVQIRRSSRSSAPSMPSPLVPFPERLQTRAR